MLDDNGSFSIVNKKHFIRSYKGLNGIKIAYLLVAHKCSEQINLFIKQLLRYGDCDVYIHIDKKNAEMGNQIIKSSRVYICSIYDVRWGSFEIVKAAIELMKLAMNSKTMYTHIYFGSGQDMLVKKGLYSYLSLHSQNIFVRIINEVKDSDRASARYKICWPKKLMIRDDLHPYRVIRIMLQYLCKIGIVVWANNKKLRKKVKFYEGRTWFIAPIEAIEYILEYISKNPDYLDFWEDSLASDLMFFQTIIMNSPFADKVLNELMYVNFGKTFSTMNHPQTITMDVVDSIKCGDYFCARKFEYYESRDVITYFEKNI